MMKSEIIRMPQQVEHLAQVRALTQAIASAISAIEKNNLREFESQVSMQETLCNRVSGTKWALSPKTKETAASDENLDEELLREIWQAHLLLAQVNRAYAELVKRSRRFVELLAVVYRSHGEGYARRPSPLPQRHTWSCEV